MFTMPTTTLPAPARLTDAPVNDAGPDELIGHERFAKEPKAIRLSDTPLVNLVTAHQVLKNGGLVVPAPAALNEAINAYRPSESDWQDFTMAVTQLGEDDRNELMLDPGVWEKHANVWIAAIIALNVARVSNAQLRGHFSVMAADAAKAQGSAIVESGKAAFNSAITAAVVSGAIAGFAMFKTFQGQGLKHADINVHKRSALDANTLERDLKHHRARAEWDPQTTYKIKTFDDFGRTGSVDFKPKGSVLTPREQAWFDGEILKAQKVGQASDWLSQLSTAGIEKKLEIGRTLNAISMSLSQVVSSMVRISEHTAREKEVLQQSAQNTQKSLSDEVAQKDSADGALLQKLMDMLMQILQSRVQIIGSV
jgi:invasin C